MRKMIIYKSNDFWKKEGIPHIAVNYHKSNVPLLSHCHDFCEMVFIVNGNGYHTIDSRQYPLVSDTVVFIDPYISHSMSFSDDIEYYDLLIDRDILAKIEHKTISQAFYKYHPETVADIFPIIYFSERDFSQIVYLLKIIQSELQRQSENYMNVILHVLETLLIFSARSIGNQPVSKEVDTEVWAQNMMVYIANHYNQNISLELLSKKYGYSTSYISRYFKKQYGMNYYRYLTEIRIKNAIELLKSTNYSVEKIAQMVGYSSRSQFCKNFKSVKNRTVSEYMKKRSEWIQESLKDYSSE